MSIRFYFFFSKNCVLILLWTTSLLRFGFAKEQQQEERRHADNDTPPHILFIITDQFRHDSWSHSPTKQAPPNDLTASTPNFDFLAQHGVRFSNAYASTPTCTPSRSGMLTGRSPWRHGMLGYRPDVSCQEYTTMLPDTMTKLGNYETYMTGKNHFGYDNKRREFITHGYSHQELYDGLTAEWDDYDKFFHNETSNATDPLATCGMGWNCWRGCPYQFQEYLHPTAWTAREAVDYIEKFDFFSAANSNNKRMFLKTSFHRPHSPYDPPKRLYDKYMASPKIPLRKISRQWDEQYYVNYKNSTMPDGAWKGDPGHELARKSRASYLASIEYVDEGIGQILKALRRRGVLDDFFILWTADHGDLNGDHYLWRKGYFSNKAAKVPMVIKWPAKENNQYIPNNSISPALVEMRDIAPTFFDLANILPQVQTKDPDMDGKSLLPLLHGHVQSLRDTLDLEHAVCYDVSIHWNAIVDEHIKYVFNAHDGSEMLFNTTADPDELFDLAFDAPTNPIIQAELKRWRNRLIDQFEKEQRGDEWIKNGTLVSNRKNILLGPNYPCLKHEDDNILENNTNDDDPDLLSSQLRKNNKEEQVTS